MSGSITTEGGIVNTSNPLPVQPISGNDGGVNETGTTAVTGDFFAIQVIEAATFTTLTRPDFTGDALTGVEFPAGFVIYGKCTAFTLSAGKVIAYNRS